jgi:hypothetical protein
MLKRPHQSVGRQQRKAGQANKLKRVRRTVLEPQLCRERFDAPLRLSPAELPAECLRLEGFFGKAPEQGHLRFRHRLFAGRIVAVRRGSASGLVMHGSFSAWCETLMLGAPIRFPRGLWFGERCAAPPGSAGTISEESSIPA